MAKKKVNNEVMAPDMEQLETEKKDLVSDKTSMPKTLVYVGPTLASTLLWQNRTFSGGYPADVERLQEKHPYIKRLFVEPHKVPDAMRSIAKKGSAMNVYFNRMKGV